MEAITQSMLGMFLRCPHQFERRYLRGEIIPRGLPPGAAPPPTKPLRSTMNKNSTPWKICP